ncbi:MAG: CoA-binding protein [Armatimonadetes bacterium]|nr:MAG: CoA-binding protein [Armatimonadota bacterium]
MASDAISRLDNDPLIAVVGATDTPGKYGGIVYRNLKEKGYRVVAVNPSRSTVDGDPTVATITDIQPEPDIVTLVVPPTRTLSVLDEVAGFEDAAVWIQPGAADEEVRDKLDELGLMAVLDACIMVVSQPRPDRDIFDSSAAQ